jgi:hypothetical protein
LEGALTAQRIWEHTESMRAYFWKNKAPPAAVTKWFLTQEAWTQQMIAANPTSPLWQHVALITAQLNGLIDGYNTVSGVPPLSRFDFQMNQATGDLLDLLTALKPMAERPQWHKMTPDEAYEQVYSKSLCSAIVKVTGDYSDLFASHSSWFTYSAMNRIYKHYSVCHHFLFVSIKRVSYTDGSIVCIKDSRSRQQGIILILSRHVSIIR